MIRVERCSGPVAIADLELDGNSGRLLVGGQYGDVGWQIPAVGIQLVDNRGPRLSAASTATIMPSTESKSMGSTAARGEQARRRRHRI